MIPSLCVGKKGGFAYRKLILLSLIIILFNILIFIIIISSSAYGLSAGGVP